MDSDVIDRVHEIATTESQPKSKGSELSFEWEPGASISDVQGALDISYDNETQFDDH